MSEQELYYSTYHEAAHTVVALALGCRIQHIECDDPGAEAEIGWLASPAPAGEADTILAAGYAMDLLIGRNQERAWAHSQVDRDRLRRQCAEETGLDLSDRVLEARFLEGATQSQSILSHEVMRKAIDGLASALRTGAESGTKRLSRAEIYAITGLHS